MTTETSPMNALYRPSMALLTDLYQLTMAHGYWRNGREHDEAVFYLFFRSAPFGGRFAVAAGLQQVVEWIEGFRFDADDIAYLSGLVNGVGEPSFEPPFLRWLEAMRLTCDVHAVAEGTVVFPGEPLLRVRGPLIQCQLLETALLNIINFQTLVATKAARVVAAAGDQAVLEFGLRRAQGIDGGASASRAAFIGGCVATSNVLAGKLHGIPVRGTHAHSWVMSFKDEAEAFRAYAQARPDGCVLLVDTYDTIEGVREAIAVGKELRANGGRLAGIRLDSGDLGYLSRCAREMLDAAGLTDTVVVASSDLDEHTITRLKQQGAPIDLWGVGTRLVTGFDQPALGGVYKLAAVRRSNGTWEYKAKLTDDEAKRSLPGFLQVVRVRDAAGRLVRDIIIDEIAGTAGPTDVDEPVDGSVEWMLRRVIGEGKRVADLPTLEEIQQRARRELAAVGTGKQVSVDLDPRLRELRDRLTPDPRETKAAKR